MNFANITEDKELLKLLQNRFELLFTSEKALLPIMNHVDVNMFGSLPLTLYRITKEQRYYDLGMPYADTQWQLPANANAKEKEWHNKGYSWQSRLWIDDMYMITIVQTQAYKVTGNRKYVDRAAKEWYFIWMSYSALTACSIMLQMFRIIGAEVTDGWLLA